MNNDAPNDDVRMITKTGYLVISLFGAFFDINIDKKAVDDEQ